MKIRYIDRFWNVQYRETEDEEQVQYKEAIKERTNNWYTKPKINKEDVSSSYNFLSIAPKKDTARWELNSAIWEATQQSLALPKEKTTWEKIAKYTTEPFTKYVAKPALETVSRALDITARPLYGKAIKTYDEYKPTIYNAKKIYDYASWKDKDASINIKDVGLNILWFDKLLPPSSSLKEKIETVEMDKKVEYVLWVKSLADTVDYRTINEKRQNMLSSYTPKEQEELKKLDWLAMTTDVAFWVASWLLTWNALSTAAKAKNASIYLKALDKTVNPNLSNMAKWGAAVASLAWVNYWLTGKWLFDKDDAAANEWAAILLWGLWLKIWGEVIWWASKIVKSLFSNKEFADWFNSYNKNLQATLPRVYTKPEQQRIYKTVQELYWQQSMKGLEQDKILKNLAFDDETFHPKFDNIKQLVEDGIMEERWLIVNSKWKPTYSFVYTEEAKRFLPEEIRVKMEAGEEIGAHYPKELYEKINSKTPKAVNADEIEAKLIKWEEMKNRWTISLKENIQKEWMWDKTKSTFNNIVNYYWNKVRSKVSKDAYKFILWEQIWDKSIWSAKWIWRWADRKILNELLSADSVKYRIPVVTKKLQKIRDLFADNEEEYKKFSAYLFTKSRYQKTIWQEAKWKPLITTLEDWTEFTKEQMKAIIAKWDWTYSKIAEQVYAINKEILNLERRAWIISQETMDKYLRDNPYYIPDQLTQADRELLAIKANLQPSDVRVWKKLKEGSKTMTFWINSLEQLQENLAVRITSAAKVQEVNSMIKFWADSWIVRVYKDGKKLNVWEALIPFIRNWEREYAVVPKFVSEWMAKASPQEMSTMTKVMSRVTMINKMQITWWLAPIFQLKTLTYEPVNALIYAFSKWQSIDFIKAIVKNRWWDLASTKEWKAILREIAERSWQWYTFAKEILWDIVDDDVIAWRNKISRALVWTKNKIEEISSSIETYSTRFPLYRAALKQMGLTKEIFDKAVKDWNWDTETIISLLKEKGIDTDLAWVNWRSVFDFNTVTNTIKTVSKWLPYVANIPVISGIALKKTFENNPKRIASVISMAYIAADLMASYNTWKKDLLGILDENEEQWKRFNLQWDYLKFKPWLINFSENWEDVVSYFQLGKNVSIFEPIYAMVLSHKLSDQEQATTNEFNKMFQSFMPFVDFSKEWWIDWSKLLPPVVREGIEVGVNKDFYTWKDLIPEEYDYEKYPTMSYIPWKTSETSIVISRALANITGWEIQENWLIEWWHQISPIVIDKYLDAVDKWLIRWALDRWVYWDWNSKYYEKFRNTFINALTSKYKEQTTEQDIFDVKGIPDTEKMAKNKLKAEIRNAENWEEIKAAIKDTILKFWVEEWLLRQDDAIKNLIKDKIVEQKYWQNAVYLSKSSARDTAKFIFFSPDDETKKSRLADVIELQKAWIITTSKFSDTLKEYMLLKRKEN